MIQTLVPWIADALTLLGLVVLTISVYGLLRMPRTALRLHASGKAGLMGVLPILIATALGDPAALPRALLIGAFLVLTTPVVAHEIGRAAYLEQLRTGSADESSIDERAA